MSKWQRVGIVLMFVAVFTRFSAGDVITDWETIKFFLSTAMLSGGVVLFLYPWE